eukprot:m.15736 g.15736  ORF g.15736 m.15736 type:complete len:72 (-) comp7904_c0_seq1:168-383(-)
MGGWPLHVHIRHPRDLCRLNQSVTALSHQTKSQLSSACNITVDNVALTLLFSFVFFFSFALLLSLLMAINS